MSIIYVIIVALLTGGISAITKKIRLSKAEKKITKLQDHVKASTLKIAAFQQAYEEEKKSHKKTINNYKTHIAVLDCIEKDKQKGLSIAYAAAVDDAPLEFLHDYNL